MKTVEREFAQSQLQVCVALDVVLVLEMQYVPRSVIGEAGARGLYAENFTVIPVPANVFILILALATLGTFQIPTFRYLPTRAPVDASAFRKREGEYSKLGFFFFIYLGSSSRRFFWKERQEGSVQCVLTVNGGKVSEDRHVREQEPALEGRSKGRWAGQVQN